jgi:hypothetical protein
MRSYRLDPGAARPPLLQATACASLIMLRRATSPKADSIVVRSLLFLLLLLSSVDTHFSIPVPSELANVFFMSIRPSFIDKLDLGPDVFRACNSFSSRSGLVDKLHEKMQQGDEREIFVDSLAVDAF